MASQIRKFKRILKIARIFWKYNLFRVLYGDIYQESISDKKCSCSMDPVHRIRGRQLCLAFEELGPTFIKLGQIIGRRPDLVPKAYLVELENLQENVKPLEFEQMRRAFEGACICSKVEEHSPFCYNCNDVHEIFEEFDEAPIASASIAQVYRAKLDGKEVAVKVARPGVMDIINLDLEILWDFKSIFTRILGFKKDFKVGDFLNEFRAMLQNELDYRNEAFNMEKFRNNFKNFAGVKIPGVYWEYTRENILVMEFINGARLRDLKGEFDRKKYAKLIASSFLKQLFEDGFFHADPHPGNIFILENGDIAFLDFGAAGRIDSRAQREFYELFYAIYEEDLDRAASALLSLANAAEQDVDLSAFKADLDKTIMKYHRKIAGEGSRTDDFIKLAAKHNIKLPSAFVILARALVHIESVCTDLDPDFNIMNEVQSLVPVRLDTSYAADLLKRLSRDYFELLYLALGILWSGERWWLERQTSRADIR